MKKGINILLVIAILITSMIVPGQKVNAASKYIKADAFIKLLVNALELELDKKANNPYIDSALKNGILKDGDIKNYNEYITRADVAVLANRADEYLHGNNVDSKLLETVLEKRISDINSIAKKKRESVAKIMAKGIIKGYGNGYYVQNRSFKGNDYITVNGAKNVISLTLNPNKRASISPDGQLIRTTNLPKNYKDYDYILECFPNSFYEHKFKYQTTKYYYKPKNLVDYASPNNIKKVDWLYPMVKNYGDTWIEKIETNLTNRFNVDYRTVNTTWISELANTYWYYDAIDIKENTDSVKLYVKKMKKNKVVIESDIIAVEPSTLNLSSGVYVRVYLKFKVKAENMKDLNDAFYGNTEFVNLKYNQWHYGVYDILLGTRNGSSNGSDYAIMKSYLNDYIYNVK